MVNEVIDEIKHQQKCFRTYLLWILARAASPVTWNVQLILFMLNIWSGFTVNVFCELVWMSGHLCGKLVASMLSLVRTYATISYHSSHRRSPSSCDFEHTNACLICALGSVTWTYTASTVYALDNTVRSHQHGAEFDSRTNTERTKQGIFWSNCHLHQPHICDFLVRCWDDYSVNTHNTECEEKPPICS